MKQVILQFLDEEIEAELMNELQKIVVASEARFAIAGGIFDGLV